MSNLEGGNPPLGVANANLATDRSGLGPVRLMLATPCFGGVVSWLYAECLLRLGASLASMSKALGREISLRVEFCAGDALISRARANLAGIFLEDPLLTHILFVDADIAFDPNQVFRLLAANFEVSGGIYPVKRLDWENASQRDYVLELGSDRRVVGEFFQVAALGGGFLLIKREVLLRLCEAHPELEFHNDLEVDRAGGPPKKRFALFEGLISPESKTLLSEDYAFCWRWRALGGKIWADSKSRLSHVGQVVFEGDFSKAMQPRGRR